MEGALSILPPKLSLPLRKFSPKSCGRGRGGGTENLTQLDIIMLIVKTNFQP